MKKISFFLIFMFLTVLLTACSKPQPSNEAQEDAAQTEITRSELEEKQGTELENPQEEQEGDVSLSEQEEAGSVESRPVQEGYKIVGADIFGYVTVPEEWIDYEYEEVMEDRIAYTDGDGRAIILSVGYNPDADPETILDAYTEEMEEIGAEEITSPENLTSVLSEVEYEEAYREYYIESTGLYIAAWAFKSEEGNMHQISAYGRLADENGIGAIIYWIAATYSLEK